MISIKRLLNLLNPALRTVDEKRLIPISIQEKESIDIAVKAAKKLENFTVIISITTEVY